MADEAPSKSDISSIFRRLRSIATNKSCFDCSAKNPTWASVTYGVFICIDCSAVHRSLGVHLSFVRSTNLDTNWTWLQLRAMQVGGNANATSFFCQHNCSTTDSQQKYNSRAAQLYREKLHNMAVTAMRTHGTKIHLDSAHDHPISPETKEVNFFQEHEEALNGNLAANNNYNQVSDLSIENSSLSSLLMKSSVSAVQVADSGDGIGPNIEAALSTSPTEAQKQMESRKPTIGVRKPTAAKKGMMGTRKGGLGAQKVSTNFSDIEKAAQMREQVAADEKKQRQLTKEEEEQQMASVRLAYQDLSIQQTKMEAKMKEQNPNKASQMERLGMGFGGGRSVAMSHSAISDMKTIEQETPNKSSSSTSSSGFSRGGNSNSNKEMSFFDDEYDCVVFMTPKYGENYFSSGSRDRYNAPYKSSASSGSSSTITEEKFTGRNSSWEKKGSSFMDDTVISKDPDDSSGRSRKTLAGGNGSGDDMAVKKFGNAKAISSEQFFGGGRDNDFERKANLARFEGSNSISSADYFGDSTSASSSTSSQHRYSTGSGSMSYSGPDLDDIREGVRAGVTKVAGKLSSLANGVMTSLQDRYG